MNISTEQSKMQSEKFAAVELLNQSGVSPVLLICEHASNFIPAEYADLGLTEDVQKSHIAWDPGALGVTQHLCEMLNAQAVVGRVSRLVYDCNRPPHAVDAVPARSEIFDVPGNAHLSPEQYQHRVDQCFVPFTEMLAKTIRWSQKARVLVTLHSFTPIYNGEKRDTDIGILHDTDSRLADAMLDAAAKFTNLRIERNKPYGPEDGVTYTLKAQGMENGLLNVMIEVRNDLIATPEQQKDIAKLLCDMLNHSLATLDAISSGGGN
ncbi:N-formylglutamate amidohydrolase [Maritalea porphyrae]|uniref:N-formylglutamate amidohydrolase n=1 Tax=Maritalea porphyrae TaxID=880732 RepID=UPI0022B04F34|nr:N-formylglutamate amidohydrolase [Maritalea porphyrae]MCZ4273467.1 N-formylglutamate amidohydrolase [Maritalea porphyrae]